MRKFEESALTRLVVDALRSRLKELNLGLGYAVNLGSPDLLRSYRMDLEQVQNLLDQIKKEKLDIRFVSRED